MKKNPFKMLEVKTSEAIQAYWATCSIVALINSVNEDQFYNYICTRYKVTSYKCG